jgi:E3 ubiquitin-protein ligase SHPRH
LLITKSGSFAQTFRSKSSVKISGDFTLPPSNQGRVIRIGNIESSGPGDLVISIVKTGKVAEPVFLKAEISPDTLEILTQAVKYQKIVKNIHCQSEFRVFEIARNSYLLRLDITWTNNRSLADAAHHKQNDFLAYLTTGSIPSISSAWSPRDFYDNVFIPDKNDSSADSFEVEGLESHLFPYQKRTVQWMLNREGAIAEKTSSRDSESEVSSFGFFKTTSLDGQCIYVNHWLGIVTTNQSIINGPETKVSGGILAEEMGLGKTVEIISLLIKNKRYLADNEDKIQSGLHRSGATLIIAPDSIISQWEAEINMHAPALRSMIYPGISNMIKDDKGRSEKDLIEKLLDRDVVLCTYRTLAREVYFAEKAPDRSLRHKKQYERKRSPLVQIDWWRCVLDECQMVESGVSNAARVANQIPRQNAWAVSGTPLRHDSGDIFGLVLFLRLMPYCWSLKLWKRLLDQYQPIFKSLIHQTTLRHTKDLVKDDIELPPQKRIVSTVSFTQIEEQHYSNMFDIMCNRIGLSREGAPLREDWDPNDSSTIETMRNWLMQLRQTCLHPQVGERNRKALGNTEGVLRTIGEVLAVMMDQNDLEMHHQERAYLLCHLRRGQLLENDGRSTEALTIWKEALPKVQRNVAAARLAVEKEKQTEDNRLTKAENLGLLKTRLRSALEIEHMAQFFIANACFQIKEDEKLTPPDSERFHELEKLEVAQYEIAKKLRQEILTEPRRAAEGLIENIQTRLKEFQGVPEIPEFDRGGIETRAITDRMDEIADQLDKQSEVINSWRKELADLLSKPLVDQEDKEMQGDEYEISLQQQDEVYVRMDVFRAIVADRADALSGQENSLIKGEVASWIQRARAGEGHAPKLLLELVSIRDSAKPPKELGSLRNILAELRTKKTSLKTLEELGNTRARAELGIVNGIIQQLQTQMTAQTKISSELDRELNLYSDTQNSRLDYYKQLQNISDSVARNEKQYTDGNYAFLEAEERKLQQRIDNRKAQARYLTHLKDASSVSAERRCVICQDDNYEIGVLTKCGHLFCKDCINQWLSAHGKCPTCKQTIKGKRDLYQIAYKPQELRMEEEDIEDQMPSSGSPSSQNMSATPGSIYSQISMGHLNEIKSIDLAESFSTKIDFIARHIIWLRKFEPGAKTVLFSQYQSFCPGHLAHAFSRLKIRFAVVGNKGGVERFKHDPTVECLLMHAGSQASGMNLVNATHVLLCEPLVSFIQDL